MMKIQSETTGFSCHSASVEVLGSNPYFSHVISLQDFLLHAVSWWSSALLAQPVPVEPDCWAGSGGRAPEDPWSAGHRAGWHVHRLVRRGQNSAGMLPLQLFCPPFWLLIWALIMGSWGQYHFALMEKWIWSERSKVTSTFCLICLVCQEFLGITSSALAVRYWICLTKLIKTKFCTFLFHSAVLGSEYERGRHQYWLKASKALGQKLPSGTENMKSPQPRKTCMGRGGGCWMVN